MDADAVANHLPMRALLPSGVAQPRKPFEWRGNFAAIGQQHVERVFGKANVARQRLKLRGQNVHATAQA